MRTLGQALIIFLALCFIKFGDGQPTPFPIDGIHLEYESQVGLVAWVSYQSFNLQTNITNIDFSTILDWPYRLVPGSDQLVTSPVYLLNPPSITEDDSNCPMTQAGSQCRQIFHFFINPKRNNITNTTECDVTGFYELQFSVDCRESSPGVVDPNCNLINGQPESALVGAHIITEDFCYVLTFGVGLDVITQTYQDIGFTIPKDAFFVGDTVYVLTSLAAENGIISSSQLAVASVTDGISEDILFGGDPPQPTPQFGVPLEFTLINTNSVSSVGFSFVFNFPLVVPGVDQFKSYDIMVSLNVTFTSASFSQKRGQIGPTCCNLSKEEIQYTTVQIGGEALAIKPPPSSGSASKQSYSGLVQLMVLISIALVALM